MIEKILLKIRNNYRRIKQKYFRSKYYDNLPRKIKYFEGSLYDAVYESAIKYPDNTAIEYYNNQITYKQLIRKINKCAKALKALGVNKGDKVTICMPNTPEEVTMFYAINEIGAVANMIHPLSSEKEIEYYLNKSESKVMLCIDISYKKVRNIIDNTKLEKVIVTSATKSMERLTRFIYWFLKGRKMDIKEDQVVMLWDHFINLSNMYYDSAYTKVDKYDQAVILYSGGTTGKPKGVIISNYSFNAQALQSRIVSDALTPDNAFLTFLPNFHAFGIGICTHTPLYNGMRAILIPQFNIKKFKSYVRKYHFNILCGVPTLYDQISKMKFKKNELKEWKLVVCGGDSMSQSLKDRVNDTLEKYGCPTDIRIGYGLTESSGVVSLSPEGLLNYSDVIGVPFPDTDFIIVDINTNKVLPSNKDGEILISGPNVMMEYLKEDEETNNVLEVINNKTYLHTGDIGYIDKLGLVHYKSRLKRMIITSGYNVYPSHIEEILMNHESVAKCAVIGIPNEQKGEIVKAFIVLKDGYNTISIKNNIKDYLKKYLAKYEIPKEIKYLDDLPTTLVGKVAYKELEKM
jgi:long-chain acyl-CoA synthetase